MQKKIKLIVIAVLALFAISSIDARRRGGHRGRGRGYHHGHYHRRGGWGRPWGGWGGPYTGFGWGWGPGWGYGPGLCRHNPGACAVGAFGGLVGSAIAASNDDYYW